jgi:cytochrome c biogenesis protein CcmG/thiol:disulfide interchange protein DsbE
VRSWLKLIGLVVTTLVVAQILVQKGERGGTGQGASAPALVLQDTGGRTVDLSKLRGRVVAVNFWASWCGPCRAEIPALAQLWRDRKGECFELLGVAEESGGSARVAQAAQELGIPYPVLVDADGRVANAYHVDAYPRTIVIDTEGKVRRVFEGAVTRREVEEAMRPLLPAATAICKA